MMGEELAFRQDSAFRRVMARSPECFTLSAAEIHGVMSGLALAASTPRSAPLFVSLRQQAVAASRDPFEAAAVAGELDFSMGQFVTRARFAGIAPMPLLTPRADATLEAGEWVKGFLDVLRSHADSWLALRAADAGGIDRLEAITAGGPAGQLSLEQSTELSAQIGRICAALAAERRRTLAEAA